MLRAAVSIVVLSAVFAVLAAAQAAPAAHVIDRAKPFKNGEAVLSWINDYRRSPQPERLPQAVKAMAGYGLIKDLDQAGVYVGFTAGVLGSNPETARELISKMFPLRSEHQVLVIRAIAYSGLIDWKEILLEFVERMPSRKVLIDQFVFKNKATLTELSMADDQGAIDVNWGYYFATGAEAPVRRIVEVLAWIEDRNDVDKMTIGAMAKWTLAQNAARDSELRVTLKIIASDVRGQARPPLQDVLQAAETLELAKVRREALDTIEEVKRKGPERVRNYQWWGQAGQTVLALGCVGAAALGQVQLGIPCVIGGALSSAALKYFTPQQ